MIYSEAETINIDGNTPGEYFNTEKRWLSNSLKNYFIWDICSKISSELLGNLKTWITSRLVYFHLIAQFGRSLDLILRIILKYVFLDIKSLMAEIFLF